MYRHLSVIAIVPVLNEEAKIGKVIVRVPGEVVDEVLVVDDGSTDRSVDVARSLGVQVVSLGATLGVGAALQTGYRYAIDQGYDVAVTVAGNNKDAPEEIPLLLEPIAESRADFVQGSRFLKRGANLGAMPAYRQIATRLHPLLFSLVARRWVTESTNGFRAVRTRVLADPRLDLSQAWLRQYELEPYLYLRTVQLGYHAAEVPVTKIYPPRHLGQTKMKPIADWWSILRPLVYVGLGLRK
jgi:dolichol-phosphate mannosyltransferase